MARRKIVLCKLEDLKVFMSPQRQKLLRYMQINGQPMTSKAIADMLDVSTSSAQFHIRKLEKLGIVELDHTEMINGIRAKYYCVADVDVSIGTCLDDHFNKERHIIMQNVIKDTFEGFIEIYDSGLSKESHAMNSEFLNGVVHLSQEDAKELHEQIAQFVAEREHPGEGTQPWEFTLLAYNADTHKRAMAMKKTSSKSQGGEKIEE